MSAMPTTLDPKPPAAFPVGYAAGVGTAIPNDGQAWHIAGPTHVAPSVRTKVAKTQTA